MKSAIKLKLVLKKIDSDPVYDERYLKTEL